MSLHPTAFEYHKPNDSQMELMAHMRQAFAKLAHEVEDNIRPCEDRDHVIRLIRDAAMWANVAITREADGAPR